MAMDKVDYEAEFYDVEPTRLIVLYNRETIKEVFIVVHSETTALGLKREYLNPEYTEREAEFLVYVVDDRVTLVRDGEQMKNYADRLARGTGVVDLVISNIEPPPKETKTNPQAMGIKPT